MTIALTGKTIGENIKLARLAAGLTGEQLAEKLGATAASVYRYEAGAVVKIPRLKIEKIAEVCGVTVEELQTTVKD